MDVLLGVDFAVAEKDRLYRCLDRILKHKADLFVHLQQRWKNLFDVPFDVPPYDLTSTYVEGEAVEEVTRHAAELPETRPVADARGRGQDGGRACLRIRPDQLAQGRSGGHPQEFYFPTRR